MTVIYLPNNKPIQPKINVINAYTNKPLFIRIGLSSNANEITRVKIIWATSIAVQTQNIEITDSVTLTSLNEKTYLTNAKRM